VQAVGRPSLIELKYMLNNQKLKWVFETKHFSVV
jgi:hypothetical protein